MRAAVVERPRRLVVKEVEAPSCGDQQILVKVSKASICNTSDWEAYVGSPFMVSYVGGYPHILGHECSGHVVEVGPRVRGYSVQDRLAWYVKGTGAFAEYNLLTPKNLAVVRLHDSVSDDEGALLELAGGAVMRNVCGAELQLGDTAAVIGVGPAGLYTGVAAQLSGASAWLAVDLVRSRLEKALELGASAAYNVLDHKPEQLAKSIQGQFGDVDIVFETMGQDQSHGQSGLEMAINIAKPGGSVRLFSIASTPHRLPIGAALMKGVNLVGRKVSRERTQTLLELAHRWVRDGRYPVTDIVTHHIPLEDVEDGLKLVHECPERAIKVMVDV